MAGTPKRNRKPDKYYRKGEFFRESTLSNKLAHERASAFEKRVTREIDELNARALARRKAIHLLDARGASVVSQSRRDAEIDVRRMEERVSNLELVLAALARKKGNVRKH